MNDEMRELFRELELENNKLKTQQKKVNELEKFVYSSYQETKEKLLKLKECFILNPNQENFSKMWKLLKFDYFNFSQHKFSLNIKQDNISMCDEILYISQGSLHVDFNFESIKDVEVENFNNKISFKLTNDLGTLYFIGEIREEFYKINYAKKYNVGEETK